MLQAKLQTHIKHVASSCLDNVASRRPAVRLDLSIPITLHSGHTGTHPLPQPPLTPPPLSPQHCPSPPLLSPAPRRAPVHTRDPQDCTSKLCPHCLQTADPQPYLQPRQDVWFALGRLEPRTVPQLLLLPSNSWYVRSSLFNQSPLEGI